MKKIGLEYPVVAKYNETTGAYTEPMLMADIIKTDIKWSKNAEFLYASNKLNDLDQSVIEGTEQLDIVELPLSTQAYLLGHSFTNEELIINENDCSPQVGHGFISKIKEGGVFKWAAVWLPRVQFAEFDDATETQKKEIKFQTPSLPGVIMKDLNGDFIKKKTFTTLQAAKDYINNFSGLVDQCTTPVSSLTAGTYTSLEAEDVTLTAGDGESIYYTTNGTTPSATNGTLYSVPFDITASCMLRAIAIKSGQGDSEVAEYEYFIS